MAGFLLMLKRVPIWVWVALAALIIFYFALDAYGDKKYAEGKTDEAAAWQAASDKAIANAAASGKKADKAAAGRLAQQLEKVENEKERMDAAVQEGSSPMDVLFGPSP
jgi:hypothetical protein